MNISSVGIHFTGIVALLPISLIVSLLFAFTPYLTRKSETFGVSIPVSEYANPALKALRRGYRNRALLLGALLLAVLPGFSGMAQSEAAAAMLLLAQLALSFGLYLIYYRKAKAFKAAQNWEERVTSTIAVDLSPASQSFPSAAWLLVYPLVIALTAALGLYWYPGAPERMVRNWNGGVATAWVDKSYGVLWFILFMQASISVLLCFVFFLVKNARRQIDPERLEESAKRSNLFRRSWGRFLLVTGVGVCLLFTVMMGSMFGVLDMRTVMLLVGGGSAALLAGGAWLSCRVGQGGSRVKLPREDGGCTSVRDDDRFWKLGTIYYNPGDPAVFVEKRFGIGWTCNFARPLSWVCVLGLFAFIGLTVWISNLFLG